MLLPCLSHLILLMETNRSQAVARDGAENPKDGTFSTWHNAKELKEGTTMKQGET